MAHNIPKIEYGNSPTVISFDYPPVVDDGDEYESKAVISDAISGIRQVSVQNIEAVRKLKFSFLSESKRSALDSFFTSHAGYGKSFKYFEDKNGVTFSYYELDELKFQPKKITAVGENAYIYELPLKLRRVLGLTQGEDTVFQILNNQVAAANIAGLILDYTQYTSAVITAELRRKTDTQEVLAIVYLVALYDSFSSTWDITPTFQGADCGVDFSITTAGQVQYTSSNLTGSNYSGTLKAKQSLFGA